MIVPDSVSNIFSIADGIGAVIVGNMNDARVIVTQIRATAADFKNKFSYECPIAVLAQRMGARL